MKVIKWIDANDDNDTANDQILVVTDEDNNVVFFHETRREEIRLVIIDKKRECAICETNIEPNNVCGYMRNGQYDCYICKECLIAIYKNKMYCVDKEMNLVLKLLDIDVNELSENVAINI